MKRHTLKPLDIMKRMRIMDGDVWGIPKPFGPEGWVLDTYLSVKVRGRIIVTIGPAPGSDVDWLHASISRDTMPTYEDLTMLHAAVFRDGWAYQVFAPSSDHVNIHDHALHLWGRPDGRAVLPNFGAYGSI